MAFGQSDIEVLVRRYRPIGFGRLVKQNPADNPGIANEPVDPRVVAEPTHFRIIQEISASGADRFRESVGPEGHIVRA